MQESKLRWTKAILMLSMLCLLNIASCQPVPVKTVEVQATSKGCSRAFVEEHDSLFAENIRLKAALKACQGKP